MLEFAMLELIHHSRVIWFVLCLLVLSFRYLTACGGFISRYEKPSILSQCPNFQVAPTSGYTSVVKGMNPSSDRIRSTNPRNAMRLAALGGWAGNRSYRYRGE